MVYLGSSRAETGLSPDYGGFNKAPVYNAGLKGSSMYEIYYLVKYLLRHQQPQSVVLGLDFFLFNENQRTQDDFALSPLAEDWAAVATFTNLVSTQTLYESWYTLKENISGRATACSYNGQQVSKRNGTLPREAFDKILTRYVSNPALYGDYELSKEYLELLRSALEALIAADVKVYAFISPAHALHSEAILELGLQETFEDWKRRVVEVVTNANDNKGGEQHIILWDFSGYNSITTEAVPDESTGDYMRWFRDSSHYRPVVGNMVMQRITGKASAQTELPPDFGRMLSSDTLEALLSDQRAAGMVYRQANVDELEHLRTLIRDARAN